MSRAITADPHNVKRRNRRTCRVGFLCRSSEFCVDRRDACPSFFSWLRLSAEREAHAERHAEFVIPLFLEEHPPIVGLADHADDVAGWDADAHAGLEHERPIVVAERPAVRKDQVGARVGETAEELGERLDSSRPGDDAWADAKW